MSKRDRSTEEPEYENKPVDQSKLLGTLPVVYNVANFSAKRCVQAKPALIGASLTGMHDNHVSRIRARAARHVRGL